MAFKLIEVILCLTAVHTDLSPTSLPTSVLKVLVRIGGNIGTTSFGSVEPITQIHKPRLTRSYQCSNT